MRLDPTFYDLISRDVVTSDALGLDNAHCNIASASDAAKIIQAAQAQADSSSGGGGTKTKKKATTTPPSRKRKAKVDDDEDYVEGEEEEKKKGESVKSLSLAGRKPSILSKRHPSCRLYWSRHQEGDEKRTCDACNQPCIESYACDGNDCEYDLCASCAMPGRPARKRRRRSNSSDKEEKEEGEDAAADDEDPEPTTAGAGAPTPKPGKSNDGVCSMDTSDGNGLEDYVTRGKTTLVMMQGVLGDESQKQLEKAILDGICKRLA
jgi:hypothetical protein